MDDNGEHANEPNDSLLEAQQRQKLQALGLLAAAVAHDFNNQLTAIIGHASILQDALPVDHPERASIDEILASSEQAAGLARQLLDFSRTAPDRNAPFDLNDVARDAHSLLRRVIGVDVRLHLDLDPTGVRVAGDRSQIAQVLMNLVMNARDALANGRGNVWIRTCNQLEPNGGEPLRYGVVEVEDDGEGMEERVRTRLFEPFFSTRRRRRGTGLGLAIVLSIVERHHGRVGVDSELGRGTRMRVLLPAGGAAQQERISNR